MFVQHDRRQLLASSAKLTPHAWFQLHRLRWRAQRAKKSGAQSCDTKLTLTTGARHQLLKEGYHLLCVSRSHNNAHSQEVWRLSWE